MRLLTHLANNTEQFKRKFESPSEDGQRFGNKFGQWLERKIAPFCKKYYDRSLFDPLCGKAYSFIANDRTAKQVCKQFANKSSFEIQKTYKNIDGKYGEEVFSYEGGKKWVYATIKTLLFKFTVSLVIKAFRVLSRLIKRLLKRVSRFIKFRILNSLSNFI